MANTDSAIKDPAQEFKPSDEMLASVQANMDKADFGDDKVSTPEVPAEATPVETPPTEEKTTPTIEPTDTPPTEKSDEVVLPDAYRRAAIHNKWTPEEIDTFFKRDPDLALKTFENIHTSTNEQSRGWANLGQATIAAQNKTAAPDPAPVSPAQSATGIDLSKLEEEYADDPILDVVKKLVTQVTELGNRPAPAQVIQQTPATDMSTTEREIQQFFSDPTLMADPEYYGMGKERGDLTPNQQANRDKVLMTGDHLIVGAAAHGQDLSNMNALAQAHLLEAAPSLKSETVADIKTTLTKREQNIDFKPTAAQPIAPTEKDKEKGVIARAAKGLKALYNKK